MRRKKQSDCDLLLNDVENVFGSLGSCLDSAFDEKKSKMDVVKGAFGFGKNLLKFGFNGTKCAVKHTPKAIAIVADVKRKVIDGPTEEYSKIQKEMKEDALNEKIKRLQKNKRNKDI